MLDERRTEGPVLASPLKTTTLGQIEKAGVHYPDVHRDPEKMVGLASMIYREFGWESLRIPFDVCLEAEEVGAQVNWGTGSMEPYVTGPRFDGFASFRIPADVGERGRFPVLLEAVRLAGKQFPDLPVFVQVLGPFTLGAILFGIKEFMVATIKDPVGTEAVLADLTDFLIRLIRRIHGAGDAVVSIMDGTASGNMMSPKTFNRFVVPCYRKMTEEAGRPMILHLCGDTRKILGPISQSGFRGFSFEGPTVSPQDVLDGCGEGMIRIGNVSAPLIANGTPEEVEEACEKVLEQGVDILAPGCGIHLKTPGENLRAMGRALSRYVEKKSS